MKNQMSPESQEVYDVICKVGSLTDAQVALIDRTNNAETTVKFLDRYNFTKHIGDNYIVPFFKKTENYSSVACMWVLLNLISNAEGLIDHDKLDTLIEGNSVINFSYIHDDSKVINFVYLDEGFHSKIAAIKQRFYDFTNCKPGEEKTAGIIHIFCTTNPEVFVKVSEIKLPLPHKLVLLEGDLAQKPTLKFA